MNDNKIADYAKRAGISLEEAKKQIENAEKIRTKNNKFVAPSCIKFEVKHS